MNNEEVNLINDYINTSSKEVEGWFFPIDMLLFTLINEWHQRSSTHGDIAEVGVYKGKSLILLSLLSAENESIYAMDIFEDGLLTATQSAVNRFVPEHKREQINYLVEDTANYNVNYLRENIQRPLRLLHIDAGHEHHEVLHSLELLTPFVDNTGVVIMDDYQDREFPGVSSAVLEFCYQREQPTFVPFLAGANKMYLTNSFIANAIQKYLLQHPLLVNKCRLTRTKDNPVLIAMSKLPQPSEKLINILSSYDLSTIDEAKLAALAAKAKILGQQKIA